MAQIIMKDLDSLTSSRDMDYVNKIFIPLIKLEKTLPISFSNLKGLPQVEQKAAVEDDQIVEKGQIGE